MAEELGQSSQHVPVIVESIIVTNKGTAHRGTPFVKGQNVRHHKEPFNVVSDSTDGEGRRTLVLEPRDMAEITEKRAELLDTMLERLGEQASKALRGIIKDVLDDYWDEAIEGLYQKIVVGAEAVKARDHCFELLIGDGRKKGAELIVLRN